MPIIIKKMKKFALIMEPLTNSLLVYYSNRLFGCIIFIIFNLSVQDQTEGNKNTMIKISTLHLIYNHL